MVEGMITDSPQHATGHLAAVINYERPLEGYLWPDSEIPTTENPALQSRDCILGAQQPNLRLFAASYVLFMTMFYDFPAKNLHLLSLFNKTTHDCNLSLNDLNKKGSKIGLITSDCFTTFMTCDRNRQTPLQSKS